MDAVLWQRKHQLCAKWICIRHVWSVYSTANFTSVQGSLTSFEAGETTQLIIPLKECVFGCNTYPKCQCSSDLEKLQVLLGRLSPSSFPLEQGPYLESCGSQVLSQRLWTVQRYSNTDIGPHEGQMSLQVKKVLLETVKKFKQEHHKPFKVKMLSLLFVRSGNWKCLRARNPRRRYCWKLWKNSRSPQTLHNNLSNVRVVVNDSSANDGSLAIEIALNPRRKIEEELRWSWIKRNFQESLKTALIPALTLKSI